MTTGGELFDCRKALEDSWRVTADAIRAVAEAQRDAADAQRTFNEKWNNADAPAKEEFQRLVEERKNGKAK